MTNETKRKIKEEKTIGYWSVLGGLELKKIEYGIEDYAFVVSGAWNGKRNVHKLKIKQSRLGDYVYIQLGNTKYYFDECIRN